MNNISQLIFEAALSDKAKKALKYGAAAAATAGLGAAGKYGYDKYRDLEKELEFTHDQFDKLADKNAANRERIMGLSAHNNDLEKELNFVYDQYGKLADKNAANRERIMGLSADIHNNPLNRAMDAVKGAIDDGESYIKNTLVPRAQQAGNYITTGGTLDRNAMALASDYSNDALADMSYDHPEDAAKTIGGGINSVKTAARNLGELRGSDLINGVKGVMGRFGDWASDATNGFTDRYADSVGKVIDHMNNYNN